MDWVLLGFNMGLRVQLGSPQEILKDLDVSPSDEPYLIRRQLAVARGILREHNMALRLKSVAEKAILPKAVSEANDDFGAFFSSLFCVYSLRFGSVLAVLGS